MSKYNCTHKRDRIKWIIVFSLIVILGLGLIGGLFAVNHNVQTIQLTPLSYKIGTIDDTGLVKEGNTSIYTDNYFNVDGLKITKKDDATVTYKLFYYNSDKEFLSASDTETVTVPANAKYFRIMVTPNDGTDITFTQIAGYSNQISVVINK